MPPHSYGFCFMKFYRDMQVVALVCFRGGNWNNGSNYGPFYENWNYTPSNTNINYGDRDILSENLHIPAARQNRMPIDWQVGNMPKIAGECKRMLMNNTRLWNVTLEDVCNHDNALKARRVCFKNQRSTRGKKFYGCDQNLFDLADSLASCDFEHQGVRVFTHVDKYSGKSREIHVPSVRDKLIMHMLIIAMKPYMIGYDEPQKEEGDKPKHHDGYLIKHTIASIEGRGIEFGRKCLRYWARTGGSSVKYVVKWDLKKYYDSVDNVALLRWLKRRIKDKRIIKLWWVFLYRMRQGLVIGSPLSQWAANIVFGPIGHWIKAHKDVSHHLQYMDDGVAFFSSKRKAERFVKELESQCSERGLTVKQAGNGSLRIWRWKDAPVDMLGYKTYRTGFQEMRGKIYLSITRQLARIEKKGCPSRRQARSVLSRKGMVQHSDCTILYSRMVSDIHRYRMKEIAYENHIKRLQAV